MALHGFLQAAGTINFKPLPGFKVEVFAASPEVEFPSSMVFDENGRLFVVETLKGEIRLLRAQPKKKAERWQYEIFATGLPGVISVVATEGGLLASAPPNIWFLKDTDGDGKADVRNLVLTGLESSKTSASGRLRFGQDGWVYGQGSTISGFKWSDGAGAASLTNWQGSFRFRHRQKIFEDLVDSVQTSENVDDFDRSYVGTPEDGFLPAKITNRTLRRNPFLILPEDGHHKSQQTKTNIEVMNRTGFLIYNETLFGPRFKENIFAFAPGKPLVVGALVIDEDTPGSAEFRIKEEFLSFGDTPFQITDLSSGPDGALYICGVSGDAFDARRYGAIYRISPTREPRQRKVDFKSMSGKETIERLGSSDAWWRRTAQRLLIEGHKELDLKKLRRLAARSKLPAVRVAALHTLNLMGKLDSELIFFHLGDSDENVCANAVELVGELLRESQALAPAVLPMVNDPSPRVRLALALTLGEVVAHGKTAALARLAQADGENPSAAAALLSSSKDLELSLYKMLQPAYGRPGQPMFFLKGLARILAARKKENEIMDFLKTLGTTKSREEIDAGLLESFSTGYLDFPAVRQMSPVVRNELLRLIKLSDKFETSLLRLGPTISDSIQ